MTLAALIRGARAADSGKFATATVATPATLEGVKGQTVATVATVIVANPQKLASDVLPDPRAQSRRQKVLAILAENSNITRAIVVDDDAEPDAVIVTVGVRHVATADLRIPRSKYDPFLFLEVVDRNGGSCH